MMIKKIAVIILFLVSVGGYAQTESTTVYVTETGEKYHRSDCRYLSKSKIATTYKQATANGYEACKVCKPNGSGTSSSSSSKATDGRCTATTKAGTRCKRSAAAGSSRCWQH